jgi:protein O-mannosyl-transferase
MYTGETTLKRYESYLLPAIVLITLTVFSPVAWHDFISFDDDVFVYANTHIASGLTLEVVRWAFTTSHEANWIPLSMLSHALDVQVFGMNPAGHHVVNLLLHVASSCMLYLSLKRATAAPWKSAVVAFLFALHPLHVESVAWVAERKDVLSMFFGMLTIYLYQRYTEKQGIGRYCAALGCFVLGLLSKPMLVTLPLVLLLLDWWPLGRFNSVLETERSSLLSGLTRLIVEKIPFFILSIGSSIITYRVQQVVGELPQGYTFISRLGKSCIAYISYLYKMIWPVDLAILYPFSKYPPSDAAVLFSAIMLMLITIVVICYGKRFPFLVTGWLWYLITLLPVIGLIQIGQHSVADRYTYLPLTGIFVSLVWGGGLLCDRWQHRNLFLGGIAVCAIAVLITLTSAQLRYWKNSEALFKHTLQVTEGNWVIHCNLGLVYLNQGRIEEAVWHFNQSIKAKPSYSLAYLNLGAALIAVKQFDKAVDAFKWSLQFDPVSPKAHYGLGVAYLGLGKQDLAQMEYQVLKKSGVPYAEDLLEMIVAPSVREIH